MANLTISVPDDLLQRARTRAAQQGTSVSKVLRGSLERFTDDDAEAALSWDTFLAIADAAGGASPSGKREWTREGLQRTEPGA